MTHSFWEGFFVKKLWFALIFPLILAGCGSRETMETIADPVVELVAPKPAQVSVRLPDDAVVPVLESQREQIYTAEDYEIILETLSAGDLTSTVRHLSGYEPEELTILETAQDDGCRYEFVWAAAGEKGERLGRAVVLDDGSYHYCLSAVWDADSQKNTQIVWEDLFSSFCLA